MTDTISPKDLKKVGLPETDKHTSEIVPEGAEPGRYDLCYYNGEQYAPGALLCGGGYVLRCQSNGTWINMSKTC
ncbi:MAG: DUF1496 domain-containing protein [Pseudopelagicola sp.]|nr:DUF1496 domain-containing protein [Pseudopelagicola sp.]